MLVVRVFEVMLLAPNPVTVSGQGERIDLKEMSSNLLNADMQDILTRVFKLDLTTQPPPDIAEGIIHDGCVHWKDFISIKPSDIASFTKKSGQQRVSLMNFHARTSPSSYTSFETTKQIMSPTMISQ